MKLLVDVGVGRAVETWLASQGHDIRAVRDLNPSMTDDAILALAADSGYGMLSGYGMQRLT